MMKRCGWLLFVICLVGTGMTQVHAEEQYESDAMAVIAGVASDGKVVTTEPTIITGGTDFVGAWTSTDVLSDEAEKYYVITDLYTDGNMYEAELSFSSDVGKMTMFEIISGADEISKQFEVKAAYSDEIVDCYYFDQSYYGDMITIQLDNVEEISGLYWADYMVADENDWNSLHDMKGPGALIDSYGDCVGLFCAEAVEGHELFLFTEPIWRSALEEEQEDIMGDDSWGNPIDVPRSRAGT